jgi:hypothetical protein
MKPEYLMFKRRRAKTDAGPRGLTYFYDTSEIIANRGCTGTNGATATMAVGPHELMRPQPSQVRMWSG